MVNTVIKRVKKEDFERAIEDELVNGFQMKSQNERIALLEKEGEYGNFWAHIVIAILTAWWTCFLINVYYAYRTHKKTAKELHIKVDETSSKI